MNYLIFNIIFSILLLPVSFFCSFWIFREALNTAGITFREFLNHFSDSNAPVGKKQLEKNQKRIFYYLSEKSQKPEAIRKLLRLYGFSILPGIAALVLAQFSAISGNENKLKYAFIGNIILAFINAVVFLAGKIYRRKNPLNEKEAELLDVKRKRERENGRNFNVKNIIVYVAVGLFFAAVLFIFGSVFFGVAQNHLKNNDSQSYTQEADFHIVHSVLNSKGFETANIPTTYWMYDEDKINFVCAGIKADIIFEYYEYADGETTDEVYRHIVYDIFSEANAELYAEYENEIKTGGKMFLFAENGVSNVVLYKNNTVIFSCFPENTNEIYDILTMLGYI